MCGSSRPVSSISSALDLEPAAGVGQVQPARRVEAVPQVLPRVVDRADGRRVAVQPVAALGLLQQVAGGVAQLGAVVVVGAEDVRARELHQGAERVQDLRDALRVGEVVARVDHEVGAQARPGTAASAASCAGRRPCGCRRPGGRAVDAFPAGRTGTVTRRRRKERASKPAEYSRPAAPAAAIPRGTPYRARIRPSCQTRSCPCRTVPEIPDGTGLRRPPRKSTGAVLPHLRQSAP